MPSGKLSSVSPSKIHLSVHSVSVRTDSVANFEPSLQQFWSLESVGITESGQVNDDEIAQELFNSTVVVIMGEYLPPFATVTQKGLR